MQQEMLLVNAEVIQGMYDSYTNILNNQLAQIDQMMKHLRHNINSLKSIQDYQKT